MAKADREMSQQVLTPKDELAQMRELGANPIAAMTAKDAALTELPPVAPKGILGEMQDMREAGFSTEEIQSWQFNKRKELTEAGFSQGEIDTYFGQPPFDPKPIEELARANHKAYTTPTGEDGKPKEVKDFAEAFEAGLQMSSTALLAQKPTKVLDPNAPMMSRVASQVGTLLGDVPAMFGGALAGGMPGAFALPMGIRRIMMDKYELGEVQSFSDFWERLSGAFIDTAKGWLTGKATETAGNLVKGFEIVSPTARYATQTAAEISTMVTVGKALEGEVPEPQDFLETALALGFVKTTSKVAGKLRKIYAETGVKPSDLARDAQMDPTISQDLASDRDIPRAYDESERVRQREADQAAADRLEKYGLRSTPLAPKAVEGETPKQVEGEPAIPPFGGGAGKTPQEVVASRISTEKQGKPVTWQDVYTQTIDELNPIREAVKRATEGKDDLPTAQDPYELARLSRGTFGKADQFLERGTFDFHTYENNGKSLKQILDPVKTDLQGLREYSVAKRNLELTGRGIETGVDVEASRQVVAGGAKYEPVFRELVGFQNRLTKYLKDSGVLSDKAYEAMKEANKEYIPFYRVLEDAEEMQTRAKAGGLKTRQPIKKITGSERLVIDPLESIIKNTYTYIALAERNAVGEAYIDMAKKSGNMADFAVKQKDPIKPIHLEEDEIRKAFDEFLKYRVQTTRTQTTQTSKETTTSSTAEGGPSAPMTREGESKALKMVTDRVLEAMKARGFSEGEANQMLSRVVEGHKEKPSAAPTGGPASTTIIEKRIETVMKEIEKTEYIPELDIRLPNEAATIWRSIQVPLKPNEIQVFHEGKRTVYEVPADVAAAFKATDAESANLLIRIMSIPAKTLRAGSIMSPDFTARNLIRDQMSSLVLSHHGYIPILDFVRGAVSMAKQDEAFSNWMKGGGANAAMVSVDRQYLSEKLFGLSQETGLMEKAWNVFKSPLEMLRIASELTENATRLGEFKRATAGATDKAAIQEGAYASREVTLDFARIGAKMRAVNMIAAFSNAQIQGIDRVIRGFGENPVGMSARIAGAITAPSILLWLANHDDPRYKEIPQWQRDLFWIVMTNDHIYRIPKPFEMGVVFGTVPERALDAFYADNPKAFKDLEKSILDAFLPNVTPNVAQPIIEQFANRSLFTGTPIVSASAEKMLPEYQYNDYTTEAAKALGKIMGAFPGLTERALKDDTTLIGGTARALSTPALLENYVRSWTGGLGMYALQIADKALREAGVLPDPVKPTATLADIPVVKAFTVRYPSATAQSIQDFYTNYYANNRYYETFATLAGQGDKGAIDILRNHAEAFAQINGIRETLTDHSNMIRMVNKNPKMTPEDKRQLIDTIYFRMIELAQGGNKMMEMVNAKVKRTP